MQKFDKIFPTKHSVIGMIHIMALPGTPKYGGSVAKIIEKAVTEAIIYKKAGIDALMIENMHDVPYLKNNVGPEICSVMALVAKAVKQISSLPVGIQVLAGANSTALAIAQAAELEFIRAEGFVFGHVADEGYIDSQAAALLRYRKNIGADEIAIFTDIKKKHSAHAVTADVTISETGQAAEFFLSDGLIVTGKHTGGSADLSEIVDVKKSVKIPVLIGSGVNIDNLETYLPISDAVIVGSYFKENSYWENELDEKRIVNFMEKAIQLR